MDSGSAATAGLEVESGELAVSTDSADSAVGSEWDSSV
jgi:hypothetical protein